MMLVKSFQFIKEDTSILVRIKTKNNILKYLVNKGFIAIDGMSITVVELTENYFSTMFIPYTISSTIVQKYKKGQTVNLEVDPLGKQIHKYMEKYNALQ
jgi:riboflavin synthase